MAETTTNNISTFEHAATVRIMLEVSASSGVRRVDARFTNESGESVKSIHQSVDFECQTTAPAVVEIHVDGDLPPGDYVCGYVALTYCEDKRALFAALGIEFRVEGTGAFGLELRLDLQPFPTHRISCRRPARCRVRAWPESQRRCCGREP